MDSLTVAAGLLILVGLVGIAVPVLPGLLLVWGGVLLWAAGVQSVAGWVVLAICSALAVSGALLQYLVPGRRMRSAGVTLTTTLSGVALAVVGFFVVPVVGALLGFVLGVYLAERVRHGGLRHGSHGASIASTKQALRAIGLSIGIELVTGLMIAAVWVVGLLVT